MIMSEAKIDHFGCAQDDARRIEFGCVVTAPSAVPHLPVVVPPCGHRPGVQRPGFRARERSPAPSQTLVFRPSQAIFFIKERGCLFPHRPSPGSRPLASGNMLRQGARLQGPFFGLHWVVGGQGRCIPQHLSSFSSVSEAVLTVAHVWCVPRPTESTEKPAAPTWTAIGTAL